MSMQVGEVTDDMEAQAAEVLSSDATVREKVASIVNLVGATYISPESFARMEKGVKKLIGSKGEQKSPSPLLLIHKERKRQKAKGRTTEHDVKSNPFGELSSAAAYFALERGWRSSLSYIKLFPWEPKWDKTYVWDRERQLVVAGALIVAEIERLRAVAENWARRQEESKDANRP